MSPPIRGSILPWFSLEARVQSALLGAVSLLIASGTGAELRRPLGMTIIGGLLHLAAGAAALQTFSRMVRAQSYPTRPVRLIVGFAAGHRRQFLAPGAAALPAVTLIARAQSYPTRPVTMVVTYPADVCSPSAATSEGRRRRSPENRAARQAHSGAWS
jgi:hypothetical protein